MALTMIRLFSGDESSFVASAIRDKASATVIFSLAIFDNEFE
jgi:hypothetical protein